jgi:Mg-chelatase subunit ChlD
MFFSWGQSHKQFHTTHKDEPKKLLLTYSYFKLFFIFPLVWNLKWFLLSDRRSEDKQIDYSDVVKLYSPNKAPALSIWNRFGLLIAIAIVLFLFSVEALFLNQSKNNRPFNDKKSQENIKTSPTPSLNTSPNETQVTTKVKTKFEIDTDGDAVPDFVEISLNMDPNVTVESQCKKLQCEGLPQKEQVSKTKNLLLILDSSGSMAAKLGNESKMEIAKKVILGHASNIPQGMNIGLMVYGHKGSNSNADKPVSCNGIDLLSPIAPYNKTSFEASVNSFSPTGWTPIGNALIEAKKAFSNLKDQENMVIVVSDGIETCDSNPVDAAKDLFESAGIQAKIDVIGFAVDSDATNQLKEIARVGGGEYFSAASSDELQKIFRINMDKLREAGLCNIRSTNAYQECIFKDNYYKANDFMFDDYRENYVKNWSKAEQEAYPIAQKKLIETYSKFIDTSTKEYQNNVDELEKLRLGL